MASRERLLACPSCTRHVKRSEPRCPHCGGVLRAADGSVTRTAAAMLLGLTGVLNAACDTTDIALPAYGTPNTGGNGGQNAAYGPGGNGGQTATGGAGGTTGTGGTAGAGGTTGTGGTGGTAGAGGIGGAGGAGGRGGEGGTATPVYGSPDTGGADSQ